MCRNLPATTALFPVLSLWVRPCAIKVFLPPFYPRGFSCAKKNQALSACINSISRSGAEEPENEANILLYLCLVLLH